MDNTGYSGGDFYQGRGLIQLTHDYNYFEYYVYKKNTKKPLHSEYIKHRKGANEGIVDFNTRTENKYISEKEMAEFNTFCKLIASNLEYALDASGWYWNKVNINQYADIDNIEKVSAAINLPSRLNSKVFSANGINGLTERKKYNLLLKEIFNYED